LGAVEGQPAKPTGEAGKKDIEVLATEKHRFTTDRFFRLGSAFSPDGRLLTAANHNGDILVWEMPSGKEVLKIAGQKNLNCLSFSADNKKIMAGSRAGEGAIKTWDIASGQETAS
jgi:WD40 repeat protein